MGSGKTLLVETISKIINVPFVSIDSSSILQPGFKGSDPNTIFNQLFQKSGQSKELAENGIVFFDEIDNLSTYGTAEVMHDQIIAVQ
ncbi:MAG: AAA family ATPase [Deltaproteobacteria bacterium]|nr:AAA family ATPase [Deltaproteobacteria bacterium]